MLHEQSVKAITAAESIRHKLLFHNITHLSIVKASVYVIDYNISVIKSSPLNVNSLNNLCLN